MRSAAPALPVAGSTRVSRESAGFVLAVFVLLYSPFLSKAVHLDDSLFLWAAQNIRAHPLNFYGFDVNWYGFAQPMWAVTKNPPGACYYLAAAMAMFGTRELVLHLAFLLPAALAVVGIFALAKELCPRPAEAALIAALTPAFFVSSTTLMCDVLMLCAWTWAIVLWRKGITAERRGWMAAATGLVVVAELTKYFGLALVPLLLADTWIRRKRLGTWTLWLLLPLAAMWGYEHLTRALYGHGLFLEAMAYAGKERGSRGSALTNGAVGLIFLGGCCLPVLFYAPRLTSPRTMAAGALAAPLAALGLGAGGILRIYSPVPDQLGWAAAAQGGGLLVLGVGTVALAARELWRARDADAVFLFLWVAGTFVFASFFNWTANGRSLLPLAPPLGMLISRALGRRPAAGPVRWRWIRAAPLWLSGAIALLLAAADYSLAETGRSAANEIAAANARATVFFEGHWGFQYYAERLGLRPLDLLRTQLRPGDFVVVAENNTGGYPLPRAAIRLVGSPTWRVLPGLSTMDATLGAGFYSASWGPLPFALGHPADERYYVLAVTAPIGPREVAKP